MTERTAAEVKRQQRARWRAEGWTEVLVRVAAEHADAVRDFARDLPAPRPRENPGEASLPFGQWD